MKLIFSFIIVFSLSSKMAVARDIISIEHLQNIETAILVKNILHTKFKIPEPLIKISSQNNKCSDKTDAILQLCILKNGELIIKKINKYVLKNSFNIFLENTSTLI